MTIPARPPGAIGAAGIIAGVISNWKANVLRVGLDPTGYVDIWSLVNGTWSDAAIASASSAYVGTPPRTFEVSTPGTTLNVYVDGALALGPVAIPAAPAGGAKAGLYADTTGATAGWRQFDNFSVAPGPRDSAGLT